MRHIFQYRKDRVKVIYKKWLPFSRLLLVYEKNHYCFLIYEEIAPYVTLPYISFKFTVSTKIPIITRN
jgi:hypothetical protein